MNNRIDWIDAAKGYGILLVIFGHIHHFSYIYSFHIPLFFIISGYTYKQNPFGFKDFLTKKIKTLIIPYFSLGVVLAIFSCIMITDSNRNGLSDCIDIAKKLLIQKRFWTLWFLSALFVLNVLFYWLINAFKERTYHIATISIFSSFLVALYYKHGGKPLPWNIDASIMALPFFLFGYYAKNANILISTTPSTPKRNSIAVAILAIINITTTYVNILATGTTLEMWASKYAIVPLTYISAISGSLAIILFSMQSNSTAIKYIGKNSMIFFAWHQTLAMPLINLAFNEIGILVPPYQSIVTQYARDAAVFVMTLVFMTAANEIILRMNLKIFTGIK